MVITYDSVGKYLSTQFIERTISGAYVNDRVTTASEYRMANCPNLTSLTLSALTATYGNMVRQSGVQTLDLTAVTTIAAGTLKGSSVTALILRGSEIPTLAGQLEGHYGTTGFIYVPRELVDSYKAATNWDAYASQIRAIEDYPDICGGE